LPASKDHAKELLEASVLATDTGGGVWLGSPSGLYRVSVKGEWGSTALKEEVTALYVTSSGVLWVGTHDGALERNTAGGLTRDRARAGLGIRAVGFMVEGPDGSPVVVGRDETGRTRIGVFAEGAFTTYQLSRDTKIIGAAGRAGTLVLTTPGHVLVLRNGA